jgi:hypothetical protein
MAHAALSLDACRQYGLILAAPSATMSAAIKFWRSADRSTSIPALMQWRASVPL